MKKAEQIKFMEALGIKILYKLPYRTDLQVVGIYNGFFIYPYSYYWVVNGKMPLAIAEKLFDEHKELKIRVAGNHEDVTPREWMTCDEYEEFAKNITTKADFIVNYGKYKELIINKKEELIENNIESFYVDTYHIDTLKGLSVFIDTIKNNNIKTEWE